MHDLGYTKPLYILPFDHRSAIAKKLFGQDLAKDLTDEQIHFLRDFKMLVYKGYKKSLEMGIPKEFSAILCEEEFGSEVLFDAKHLGINIILTVERSGSKLLEFEYQDYKKHILDFRPEFAKILVKYNPEDSTEDKLAQKEKIKQVADFAHEQHIKFLLEVIVSGTEKQIKEIGGEEDFDIKLRPSLTVEVIKDFQNFGIEPDIWKLEGFNTEIEYEEIVSTIKRNGRENVGLVVLGRGADEVKVEHWLRVGSKIKGVVGFAVGRTIFWDVIEKFYKQKIGKAEVIDTVADNFYKFYKIFTS